MSLHKLCLFTLAATVVSSTTVGTLNVRIQEYEVPTPTPRSRPHEPAFAPDGSLWYPGQGGTSWAGSIRRMVNSTYRKNKNPFQLFNWGCVERDGRPPRLRRGGRRKPVWGQLRPWINRSTINNHWSRLSGGLFA
jgi:hypothetical protein